jgi:hypothetical protein
VNGNERSLVVVVVVDFGGGDGDLEMLNSTKEQSHQSLSPRKLP